MGKKKAESGNPYTGFLTDFVIANVGRTESIRSFGHKRVFNMQTIYDLAVLQVLGK